MTNNPELADRSRLMHEYGWSKRYISDIPGMNTRMDELQSAVLRVKLQYLDQENSIRQEIARIYYALLSATPLIIPNVQYDINHVYHQYVVRSEHRDELRAFLKEKYVETLIHYPAPIHMQPAYKDRFIIRSLGLQNTDQVCREILTEITKDLHFYKNS